MRTLLISVLLALALPAQAAAPTAADAAALARSRSWDELYLKFSSADPATYPEGERTQIARALLEGAHGLADDAVLSTSLAERSVAFHELTEGLLLAAEGNRRLEQNGQAEKLLERALVLEPKSGPAHLARAALALQENDAELALKQLDAVPRGFEAAKVKQLRAQAQARVSERKAGRGRAATGPAADGGGRKFQGRDQAWDAGDASGRHR